MACTSGGHANHWPPPGSRHVGVAELPAGARADVDEGIGADDYADAADKVAVLARLTAEAQPAEPTEQSAGQPTDQPTDQPADPGGSLDSPGAGAQ